MEKIKLEDLEIPVLIGLAFGFLYYFFIAPNEPYGAITVFILSTIISYYKRRKKHN